MSFDACIKVILASEGGFVDDPTDPGGATNLGITIATLSAERGDHCTVADVKALGVPEATRIYLASYWNPAHCGELPGGLDLMVFDAAVNSGVSRAIRLLQRAVGVDDDGAFGGHTKAAVAAMSPRDAVNAYHDAHAAFYEGLPTFWKYGKGWLARNDRTRSIALGML